MSDVDWKKLSAELRGEVAWSPGFRGAFATDASVYQVVPQAVAFPRQESDIATIVQFCREHRQPIIGRGGGTSLSGQAIGSGLVVDFSRFMNRVVAVDAERRRAVVEPGVVLDELNAELAKHGLHFAPDPATASRATIGGMIGNNACGTRSIIYGRTCDSIESLQCILAGGGPLTTRWLNSDQWHGGQIGGGRESELYRGVRSLIDQHRDQITSKIPNLPRIAAGYSLQLFIDDDKPKSLSDLIVGSEGTLALVAQATLRLRPIPGGTSLVISSFDDIDSALKSLPGDPRPSAQRR